METPAPTSFTRRHKFFFGLIIALCVLLYAAFNLWVYRFAINGKASSPTTLWQTVTSSPSPTPTPRPTGPGEYACSPEGDCNVYSNEMRRQYCTQTYADSRCLDQCGDKNKLCTK